MIQIAPSILAADFANLATDIQKVEKSGADLLHVDVMDGHFVPNISIGAPVVAAIQKVTKLPLDVHLMIANPGKFLDSFIQAGANIITVHAEADCHLHRLIQQIKSAGVRAGISLNPSTSLTVLEEVLPDIDMVLIMSVNPGFGGQSFIASSLNKITRLKNMIEERHLQVDIEVDGGINSQTAPQVIKAGANILVAGSAVYGAPDISRAIRELRGS
ncbi:ribulose-phosphate 3-epimerase [Lucifera butyrica]|nr:ribulose-phosphate 3-epimerase [Lucifera butyrica]